jgi:hypothetical protein
MRRDIGEIQEAIPQVGRTITQNSDGTLEGSVVWKIDADLVPPRESANSTYLPTVADGSGAPGSNHPDDGRLECYNRTLSYGNNGILTCTASYFGLIKRRTDPEFSFSGGVTTEPIETHPDFETFAGTAAAPLNGAKFDATTGEFLGFSEFTTPGTTNNTNLLGVENYLTPATNIVVSYWQDTQPRPAKTATWSTYIPDVTEFRKPQGVDNFLLMDESYSQVGNYYQVTRNYIGSGVKGWNKDIYDKLTT